MLYKAEIIEGQIDQVGAAQVIDGALTDYSFIKIDGKIHKNIKAENFLSSFIEPGNVVRLGIRKKLGGHRCIFSLQDGSGETHKISMRWVVAEAWFGGGIFAFLAFMAAFLLTALGSGGTDIGGALNVGVYCGLGVFCYYIYHLVKPLGILKKVKPSTEFLTRYPEA